MMMMKAVKKQKNMVAENKNVILKLVCCFLFIYSACGFKQNIRRNLPKESKLNYIVVYDTLIKRMQNDGIKGPYKLVSVVDYRSSKNLEFEVNAGQKKFIIKLDSAYNIVKWSRLVELY